MAGIVAFFTIWAFWWLPLSILVSWLAFLVSLCLTFPLFSSLLLILWSLLLLLSLCRRPHLCRCRCLSWMPVVVVFAVSVVGCRLRCRLRCRCCCGCRCRRHYRNCRCRSRSRCRCHCRCCLKFLCSTSPFGGNQVDGSPPVCHGIGAACACRVLTAIHDFACNTWNAVTIFAFI